jgi:hypothetical protein
MLAYVFWHWPTPTMDVAHYTEALLAFHRALLSAPPAGMRGSRVFLVDGAPWVPVERAFEDWYFVDDFAALGALNEAAVSGARRDPHDAAARHAAGGAGGVYRRLSTAPGVADRASWLSKPPGTGYAEFLGRFSGGELWQRQMVLGPAPEFCLLGAAPPTGVEARTLSVKLLHGTP